MPQPPPYCTYGVRVPASGVGYVPRTVAPQVRIKQEGPSLVGRPDDVPEELKLLREQNERQAWGGE